MFKSGVSVVGLTACSATYISIVYDIQRYKPSLRLETIDSLFIKELIQYLLVNACQLPLYNFLLCNFLCKNFRQSHHLD